MRSVLEDTEFLIYRNAMRLLPRIRGAGVVGTRLAFLYSRKKRKQRVEAVRGFRMVLDPHECVDSALLFMPHLYDRREIDFVEKHLHDGDVFVDVGSNIGFYALVASRKVGAVGRVVAIEAVPQTFAILQKNIELNGVRNIVPLNIGISDQTETLSMRVSSGEGLRNNRGGNSFLCAKDGDRIDTACAPLLDVIRNSRMPRIDGLKLDVEGFEFRVLNRFLAEAPREFYPRFVVLEQHPDTARERDAVALLEKHGYEIVERTTQNNHLMRRADGVVRPDAA